MNVPYFNTKEWIEKALIGKELVQICFGPYQVELIFYDSIILSVFSTIKYVNAKNEYQSWGDENGRYHFCINDLLEKTINNIIYLTDERLLLVFNINNFIEIDLNTQVGEKFTIRKPDGYYVEQ